MLPPLVGRAVALRARVAASRSANVLAGSNSVRFSGYTSVPAHKEYLAKPMTMDELLKPEGDWTEAYGKQNSRFNVQLAVSLAIAAITGYTFFTTIDFIAPPPLGIPLNIAPEE